MGWHFRACAPLHRFGRAQQSIEGILQALFIVGFHTLHDPAMRIGHNAD
jgi:hypothetical protein